MSFKKRFLWLCLACILILGCPISCMAVSSDCKLTVKLIDKEKKSVEGLDVTICKVANIIGTDYVPAEGFLDSGISIAGIVNNPSAEAANTVYQYVIDNQLPAQSMSSVDGEVIFSSLAQAIWLVSCEEGQSHSFNPFLVFLPQTTGGEIKHEVVSEPKLEDNPQNQRNIYVVKQWKDSDNARGFRPDSITIHLERDDKKVASAKLSDENGWSFTFVNLQKDGEYSVEEEAVEHYKAEYNGDAANGFVITNTYHTGEKLPQTGQLWWPIALIALAGVSFVILGIIELRNKSDEKK